MSKSEDDLSEWFDREEPARQELDKRVVGYSATPVLPGESREEFEHLLVDLYLDYEPEGPAQCDAIRTMACAIWRKQHLGIFHRAANARMKWGGFFKYPNDPDGFIRIIAAFLRQATVAQHQLMRGTQEGSTLDAHASSARPQDLKEINDAVQKISATLKEILGPKFDEDFANLKGEVTSMHLAEMGDLLTPERYLAELRVIEELDSLIERSHNRIIKMKASRNKHMEPMSSNRLVPGWAARKRRRRPLE